MVDFYQAEGYTPDDSVGYLMRRIIALLAQGVEREMEPAGLTNAQWVPLLKLYMGCASTAAELARQCELDAGSPRLFKKRARRARPAPRCFLHKNPYPSGAPPVAAPWCLWPASLPWA